MDRVSGDIRTEKKCALVLCTSVVALGMMMQCNKRKCPRIEHWGTQAFKRRERQGLRRSSW